MSRRYQRLEVWQHAMDLAVSVYRLTEHLPPQERFGLTQQMRRAAISVASNIAEGAGRGSDRDFVRFLYMARGSLQELETQLGLAMRLRLVGDPERLPAAIERVFAMLSRLINALKRQTSDVRRQTKE